MNETLHRMFAKHPDSVIKLQRLKLQRLYQEADEALTKAANAKLDLLDMEDELQRRDPRTAGAGRDHTH